MDEKLFSSLYKDVMKMLREMLPANLFYHSPEHTSDVIEAAERIAVAEHCSPGEILLLKTAALFHDTGYTRDMREHEKHGCDIASEMLARHADKGWISQVHALIMATRVPQVPQSKLEEIICDADLDYLGRDDYFAVAENLHREFLACEKVKDEKDWIQLQLKFLGSHIYFTRTSVELRQPGNLKKIKEAVTDNTRAD
jgi:predicted metal-dependent HD superfamily phosphohydrolase